MTTLILAVALMGQPSAAGLSSAEVAELAARYHHTAWVASGRPTVDQVAARFNAEQAGPSSTVTIPVRPTDIDGKGHVNNARTIEILQAGRWPWLEERGLTDESLRAEGAVLVVVRTEVDYRAEIRYPDAVRVTTTAARDGEKKVVFRQAIHRGDGTLAAEATVLMVAIDPASRKSRPVPESLRKVLDRAEASARKATPAPTTWVDLERRAAFGRVMESFGLGQGPPRIRLGR